MDLLISRGEGTTVYQPAVAEAPPLEYIVVHAADVTANWFSVWLPTALQHLGCVCLN